MTSNTHLCTKCSGEILNIEYHTRRLILKALNSSRTHVEAANKLGITDRTLYKMKKEYNIVRSGGRFIEQINN